MEASTNSVKHLNRGRVRRLNLIRLLPSLLGVVTCVSFASGQVPDLPGWELFWNDEFDGATLNNQNWEALDRRDSFNSEKQYYHPDQVTVADGNLQLTATDTPREGKDYQSGLVTSRDLFGPGRFEARINLPTSQGMWPAFWLNANQVSWPQGGEIDILENRGSEPNLVSSAYHWQTDPGPCCDQHRFVYGEYTATEEGQPIDFHADFHTYAAEWDETSIRYYVDGNLHLTVPEATGRPVFETPKNIILNLAVGGIFGGDPDATTVLPQTMLVDYVRVWQQPGDPEPEGNLLLNPGFDDGGGSLDQWSEFGNTILNVAASGSVANDGTHGLKLFGQFTGGSNSSGVTQGAAVSGGALLRAEASTYTPSWDTLFGSDNGVTMKVEFYSAFGAELGSDDFLGEVSQLIHDGTSTENEWLDHSLQAVAPAGSVEARLSFVFQQLDNDGGAIWIDSAGLFLESTLDGDYNGDGVLDAADYTAWRDASAQGGTALLNDPTPGTVDATDRAFWLANYGSTQEQAALAAVPEAASVALALFACLAPAGRYR